MSLVSWATWSPKIFSLRTKVEAMLPVLHLCAQART